MALRTLLSLRPSWLGDQLRSLVEAAVVTVVTAVAALAFNAVRPTSIPWIAAVPYQTLVPCPDLNAEVEALSAQAAMTQRAQAFWLDARDAEAFALRHFDTAVNVPYDYLDPTPPERLKALAQTILVSGKSSVWVYGDGANPDSGEQLAKEVAASGIRNVGYIVGGAPALWGAAAGGTP